MTAAPGPQQPDEDPDEVTRWHLKQVYERGQDEFAPKSSVWQNVSRPAAPSAQPDEAQCLRTIDCEIVEGGGCWTHRTPAQPVRDTEEGRR